MSVRRRPHRPAPSVLAYDPERLPARDAVLAAARAQGCTCKPTINIAPDSYNATVEHDDWCALLRRQDTN
jgi:hypothetical protein